MKRSLYTAIMLLTAFSCISLPVKSQRINVMSFNIRYQNKHDGYNAWENRKDAMARFLDKHHPDVFCRRCSMSNSRSFAVIYPTMTRWELGEMMVPKRANMHQCSS